MDQVYAVAKTAASRALPEDTRRQAYASLISKCKSDDADVKKLVGSLLPACFADFTSLQEDAVDAVYDLCEDVDKSVRMTGYRTFEQISRKVSAWVKRNTDVLIQLLQVESPDELALIRELLFKHVRISPQPALSVIFDNLCSADSDDDKKATLLDILDTEGKSWIKTECTPKRTSTDESTNGKLLREGLEQVLASSPPSQLRLKIYRLLAPLPFTSSSLPTDILLLQPSTQEAYELALKCGRRPDPRAILRNWFEGGGITESFATPLDGIKQVCGWVFKWWEQEQAGGDRRSLDDRNDTDAKKRWLRVEQGIIPKFAVEAVAQWNKTKSAIPFPFLEPLLLSIALLSEIPGVDRSHLTKSSLEFGRLVLSKPRGQAWPNALGPTKKMQENYYELLSWFQTTLRSPPSSSPRVPSLTPSWESTRPMHITPETTIINPLSRDAPIPAAITSSAPRPIRLGFTATPPEPITGRDDSYHGGEARKRKFATANASSSANSIASGSSSAQQRVQEDQPRKRVAAPVILPHARKGASEMMDGIDASSQGRRPPSPPRPSLLARMSGSGSGTNTPTRQRSPPPTSRPPVSGRNTPVEAAPQPPPPPKKSTFNLEPARPASGSQQRPSHDGRPAHSSLPFHPDNIAKTKAAAAKAVAEADARGRDFLAPSSSSGAAAKSARPAMMGLSIKGRGAAAGTRAPLVEADPRGEEGGRGGGGDRHDGGGRGGGTGRDRDRGRGGEDRNGGSGGRDERNGNGSGRNGSSGGGGRGGGDGGSLLDRLGH